MTLHERLGIKLVVISYIACRYASECWRSLSEAVHEKSMLVINKVQDHVGHRLIHLEQSLDSDVILMKKLTACVHTARRLNLTAAKDVGYFAGFSYGVAKALFPIAIRWTLRDLFLLELKVANAGSMAACVGITTFSTFGIRQSRSFIYRWTSLLDIVSHGQRGLVLFRLIIWASIHPHDLEENLGDHFELFERRVQKHGVDEADCWVRRVALGMAWARIKNIVSITSLLLAIWGLLMKHLRR